MTAQRVLVVGAGIAGLAHAWAAAERGCRVTVCERSSAAQSASIRNFGMIWPIGQPAGEQHAIAMASRKRWTRLASESGIWLNPCGSMHLAHRPDELAVLTEFASQAPGLGYECKLLTPDEVLTYSPGARRDGLLAGLFSPTEACVNPRTAIADLAGWLSSRYGVRIMTNTTVVGIDERRAMSADGAHIHFDQAIVCSGADADTLFPSLLRSLGIRLCKLQMMRTPPQPGGWRLGTHLASGLTLRHYRNFSICSGLRALASRVASETPELDRYGIHVMASQNDRGEVILGDSHEYDDEIDSFDKPLVDNLILRELRNVISLPDWNLAERWHGIYAKHPTLPFVHASPLPRVHVFTGLGGAGMTLAFGAAERMCEMWLTEHAVTHAS
ncbi:MAG: TIGR03364 family FAD-dependent oxidoreductase [Phycisphaeraceae bacterium]|nr:TIGR03364 family FAD-dependent oxidoreductase [Phycisphaeraceae bacterium]